MSASQPDYYLFTRSDGTPSTDRISRGGWSFLLASVDGGTRFEVSDREPGVAGDRLAMLTIIRGLEALDQPSRVRLHTTSRYVVRGFRYGLPSWRSNGWRWEEFGEMVEVPNRDLWQRIDRTLAFHEVRCYGWHGGKLAPNGWALGEGGASVESHAVGPGGSGPAAADDRHPANFLEGDLGGWSDEYLLERGGAERELRFRSQQTLAGWAGVFQPRPMSRSTAVA